MMLQENLEKYLRGYSIVALKLKIKLHEAEIEDAMHTVETMKKILGELEVECRTQKERARTP